MELEQILPQEPELRWDDPVVFQRVWARVMPQDRPDSPIELVPTPPPEVVQSEAPTPQPRLGAQSAQYGAQLQKFLQQELQDDKTHRLLVSRGCKLAPLTGHHRHNAKRLSAAYFLLSGVRYWPESAVKPRWGKSLLATLRYQFAQEEEKRCHYQMSAQETDDLALQALYSDLSYRAHHYATALQTALERM